MTQSVVKGGLGHTLLWGLSGPGADDFEAPNRTNLKPQGGILGLSGGVFSGVMESDFYAFFYGFWPKTGIWPILKPRGPLSSHLEEMFKNVNNTEEK